MPVRPILQLGDPLLRQIALPVAEPSTPEISSLVQDLADTLAHWRSKTGYGRGIAAPQIGVGQRVIFLQLPGEQPWPLLNPEIVERSAEKIVVWDACLSFLSIFMQVERHREITVRYQDLSGVRHEFLAGGDRNLSELLQHEIDHLDGILALDRVTDHKTICTREEFEKRYRDASPYAAVAGPSAHHLGYQQLAGFYAIVKLAADAPVPDWASKGEFTSISRAADELSIVCPAENLPADVHSQHRWSCFKLEGPFPFSLTGVLLAFIEPLSNRGVPIFAISTFDTDYVLVQEEFAGVALNALQEAGHELWSAKSLGEN